MDEDSVPWSFCAGVGTDLAYLRRPEGIGILIVGAGFLFFRDLPLRKLQRVVAAVLALVAGLLLIASPYGLYLRRDKGH